MDQDEDYCGNPDADYDAMIARIDDGDECPHCHSQRTQTTFTARSLRHYRCLTCAHKWDWKKDAMP